MHVKEVSLHERGQTKKFRLCSLPVRIVCETLVLLLIFAPLLLFLFKWPSAQNLIHEKVLAVRFFEI